MNQDFVIRVNKLYKELSELGEMGREIIRDFLEAHEGRYAFDTEKEDCIWVGENRYATEIEITENDCILVHNSEFFSEYLYDMDDYNILDLAEALIITQSNEKD